MRLQKVGPAVAEGRGPRAREVTSLAIYNLSQASGGKERGLLLRPLSLPLPWNSPFKWDRSLYQEERTIMGSLWSARSASPSSVCKHTLCGSRLHLVLNVHVNSQRKGAIDDGIASCHFSRVLQFWKRAFLCVMSFDPRNHSLRQGRAIHPILKRHQPRLKVAIWLV